MLNTSNLYSDESSKYRELCEWEYRLDRRKEYNRKIQSGKWTSISSGISYSFTSYYNLQQKLKNVLKNSIIEASDFKVIQGGTFKKTIEEFDILYSYKDYKCEQCGGLERIRDDYQGTLRCSTCGGLIFLNEIKEPIIL